MAAESQRKHGRKTVRKNKKTLVRWLIEQIDGKAYRAGTASGCRHPIVDSVLMGQLGGREALLLQARELEQDASLGKAGMIWFDWYNINADIKQIHYSIQIMPELCKREGIEDPRERQLRYIGILLRWRERAAGTWLEQYYTEEIERLKDGSCSQTTQNHLEDEGLYRCMDGILHLEEPAPKPIFSARIFQNQAIQEEQIMPSKVFRKKYENKIVGILKEYSPLYVDGMSLDEALAAHGILSYAQTLEWKGPLAYRLDTGAEISTVQNIYGTIINARTLENAVPMLLPGVKRIIIIENKANYEKMTFTEEELYIFCHGFFSPKEVRFLKIIGTRKDSEIEYYHWGDMDYGGIRIFQFNKEQVFPELKPYKMGREDYERAIQRGAGVPIEDAKKEKLKKLEAGELEDLKACILENGLEIEQELLAE